MSDIIIQRTTQVIEVTRGDTPEITVTDVSAPAITIQRNDLRGPMGLQGTQGTPGQDGAAEIPPILDGEFF